MIIPSHFKPRQPATLLPPTLSLTTAIGSLLHYYREYKDITARVRGPFTGGNSINKERKSEVMLPSSVRHRYDLPLVCHPLHTLRFHFSDTKIKGQAQSERQPFLVREENKAPLMKEKKNRCGSFLSILVQGVWDASLSGGCSA